MSIRVAINGFGRIGRLLLHTLYYYKYPSVKLVAINSRNAIEQYLYYAQYDSVHRIFPYTLELKENRLIVNKSCDYEEIIVSQEASINSLPWQSLEIDWVYECTGVHKKIIQVEKYSEVGVKHVLISSNIQESIPTIVYGINHNEYYSQGTRSSQLMNQEHCLNLNSKQTVNKLINKEEISCDSVQNTCSKSSKVNLYSNFTAKLSNKYFSSASCTTNCAAFIIQALMECYTIKSIGFTTVHAYTSDQNLVDNTHSDLARSRAAAHNIIPTSTNLSDTLYKIFPDLKKIPVSCMALRVPNINVSYLLGTINIDSMINTKQLHALITTYANKTQYKYLQNTQSINYSILNNDNLMQDPANFYYYPEYCRLFCSQLVSYTQMPNVSSDFNGCSASIIFDLTQTKAITSNCIQVGAWYDNEWAYACRMHDLVKFFTSEKV